MTVDDSSGLSRTGDIVLKMSEIGTTGFVYSMQMQAFDENCSLKMKNDFKSYA